MFRDDVNVNAVMMEHGISATAARVLYVVNRYVNSSRRNMKKDKRGVAYCYASKDRIAHDIGKSRRTVDRAIAELKAAGLIESRRTTRNAHIYITYYGLYGASANAADGASNNSSLKSYNLLDTSIHLDKVTEGQSKTADDVKKCEENAHDETPAAAAAAKETTESEEKKGYTPCKGKPTPKRRQRLTKAEKEAAREKYRRMLERKLDMANPLWMIPSLDDEYRQYQSLIDTLADALSVRGRGIRVNGAELTVEQYWQVVQNISGKAIDGLFDRLKTAAVCTGITNMRAYTLASVYNAVLWHGMTDKADIPLEALYRHMAG